MIDSMSAGCQLCGADDTRALFTKQRRVFLECRGCGLVWIDPMPTAEQQAAHHEQSYREGG